MLCLTEKFWKKPYCRGPRLIKEIKPGSHPPPPITDREMIYSGFSHKKLWFSIAMLNYQRVILNIFSVDMRFFFSWPFIKWDSLGCTSDFLTCRWRPLHRGSSTNKTCGTASKMGGPQILSKWCFWHVLNIGKHGFYMLFTLGFWGPQFWERLESAE